MTQDKRPLTLDDFWNFKIVSDVQVSPDGRCAAYAVAALDRETDEVRSAIWVVDLGRGGGERAEPPGPRKFTAGTKRDWQPRWSPDGQWLAFISNRHEDKPQLHVMPAHGGEARRLTEQKDGATSPTWSPDSAHLAFVAPVESEHQNVQEEISWAKEKEEERKDKPQLRRVADVQYRFDGVGYLDKRSHLFVVPREGGEAKQLTDGPQNDFEPAWSPDGKVIAFMSNRTPDSDYNFAADVWLVDVESGKETKLTDSSLSGSLPSWSPDGQTLAFYASPEWIAQGTHNTHVWGVSRQGGDQRDLTAGFDRTIGALLGDYGPLVDLPPIWSPDGQTVYFPASDHGSEGLFRVPAQGGEVSAVSHQENHLAGASIAPDGSHLICCVSTPTQPYDIFRLPAAGGELEQLTRSNGELLDEVQISSPERFTYASVDGWEIEGWLIRPPAGNGPAPMVMHVHGGPHGMYGNTFYYFMQVLAGAGIASLYINPRGSGGYGETFMQAVDTRWGEEDFQDLMNGVDHVLSMGGIDEQRLAVTGGSYGGFMTNWAIGHTDRFACAVAINSISNLISFYGTSDVGALWFGRQMRGPFWEHWDWYHQRSPLTYVAKVQTPLLLLHSENDYRCPIEQAEQMYMALKMRRCRVELVRIPNASHSLANTPAPRHRVARWRLAKEWYEGHFKT